jgi:hypothetical protein
MKMLDKIGLCPACGYDWDGGDVYEVLRAMPSYADKTDDEVKLAAAFYEWYDDIAVYRQASPWFTDEDAAKMPSEDRRHFSRRLNVYDQDLDRTVAYACPKCNAQWDRETGERIN